MTNNRKREPSAVIFRTSRQEFLFCEYTDSNERHRSVGDSEGGVPLDLRSSFEPF